MKRIGASTKFVSFKKSVSKYPEFKLNILSEYTSRQFIDY